MGKLKSLLKAELVSLRVTKKPTRESGFFHLQITHITITIPAICLNM